jgi:hypothetical protein
LSLLPEANSEIGETCPNAFYRRLGWSEIESDVGSFRLGVFTRGAQGELKIRRSRP